MGPKSDDKKKKQKDRQMDISTRFYDNYSRVIDGLKKSLDAINTRLHEEDEEVNFGLGAREEKRLTHGLSQGAVAIGHYGTIDLTFNSNTNEYILIKRAGELVRYDFAVGKMPPFKPARNFTNCIHIPTISAYICWTRGKQSFCFLKEDFSLMIESTSVTPIASIIYGDKPTQDSIPFFIIWGVNLNQYSFNPTSNVISLQNAMQMADMEKLGCVIGRIAFDNPTDDKKQCIYMSYKGNVTVIDTGGRIHGTKRNIHSCTITALLAVGSSDYVVTGDEKGMLKLWGPKWSHIADLQAHTNAVTHLLEHPGGKASISIGRDQTIVCWSFESKLKLQVIRSPEIIDRIVVNKEMKSFLAQGPRKLILWKFDEIYSLHTKLSGPVAHLDVTWNPKFEPRVVALTVDNSVRIVNPFSGLVITNALLPITDTKVPSALYDQENEKIYALAEELKEGTLEIIHFDATKNPSRQRDKWTEETYGIGLSVIVLHEHFTELALYEKGLTFATTKKSQNLKIKTKFILAGRRDGCVCRLSFETGRVSYVAPCHRGKVLAIKLNQPMSQFLTLGIEPHLRIWKISMDGEELFLPLMDVNWKNPILHAFGVREHLAFTLSVPGITPHKLIIYDMLTNERFDHPIHLGHKREIVSLSGSQTLTLFCTAGKDDSLRIWNHNCELVRLLVLNWVPTYATFGTAQGDIFVGISNEIYIVYANKFLTVVYRNRAMKELLTAGKLENPVPLDIARIGRDTRMTIFVDEVMEKETISVTGIPQVEFYEEPKGSQRAKEFDRRKFYEEDLWSIVEGDHRFDIQLPDYNNMTKKEWDEYGRSVFTDEKDKKRNFFVSESRLAAQSKMAALKDLLDEKDAIL